MLMKLTTVEQRLPVNYIRFVSYLGFNVCNGNSDFANVKEESFCNIILS